MGAEGKDEQILQVSMEKACLGPLKHKIHEEMYKESRKKGWRQIQEAFECYAKFVIIQRVWNLLKILEKRAVSKEDIRGRDCVKDAIKEHWEKKIKKTAFVLSGWQTLK